MKQNYLPKISKKKIHNIAHKMVMETTLYGNFGMPVGSDGRSYYETEMRCFKLGFYEAIKIMNNERMKDK